MAKSFLVLFLTAILFVSLAEGEITVTFEPHNETEAATLYGGNSDNLHSGSQGYDEEEVETFYVRSGVSEADEERGDIPVTHTHSPVKEEPEKPKTEVIPTSQPFNCPSKYCSKCCQPSYAEIPTTNVKYPVHPLFPSWGGVGSNAQVIDDETEYITGHGGDQQVIFVTQPQQPPQFPQWPNIAPLPDFTPQQPSQPSHPSIIYVPHQPSGPAQFPGFDGGQIGNDIGGGFTGGRIDFNQGSVHRNHDQIWKHHQQQHQLWLQQQRQQNQFSHLVIGGGVGGLNILDNSGSMRPVNGGVRRPCDSKK